jgi:ABC-type glycerol-3-phosphate transport system permease component
VSALSSRSQQRRVGHLSAAAARHLVLLVVAVGTLGPLLWIVGISLMTTREFAADPLGAFQQLHFGNYVDVLADSQLLTFARNSLIVTGAAVAIVLVCSTLAGYALARIPFRGAPLLFAVFVASNSVPILLMVVPLFVLISWLDLSGSLLSLILPYSAMTMGISIFLMRGFFRSIPSELEGAAMIDGCNRVQVIWHVMLPLARPGLLVVLIFNFITFWNEYFLAAVLLPRQDLFTLPAGLTAEFASRWATNWPGLASGLVLSVVPAFVLFMVAQDKIIDGWARSVR